MNSSIENKELKIKTELDIQKGIRSVEDELVIAIQNALNKTEYNDLKSSQFRNLLRVADTTDSAEVIKNYIRYQVGRDKKWGRGANSLAEQIINDIDNTLKKQAQEIAKTASTKDFNAIWLKLIRLYLGYGARHLTYLKPEN